ncbi:MAG: sugar phosphate isomerase/epimerase family protein [Verrucomicrobiota bacterium]
MATAQALSNRLTIRLEVVPGRSVADRIARAADFGFAGIAFPGRFRAEFGEEALREIGSFALPITTVSLGFEGSLCSPDPAQRQICRDSLCELFDFTAALGARSLNMPPVLKMDNPDRYPSGSEAVQDALLAEQLPALGDEAAARGIELLIEPVNRRETDYLTSVIHAAKICEAVGHPAIGLTPDFYHMQFEEEDIPAALSEASTWIRHIHVAEHNRVEPGVGTLNFRPGFAALKKSGYGGLVEIECRSLSGEASEVLPRSIEYLSHEWESA